MQLLLHCHHLPLPVQQYGVLPLQPLHQEASPIHLLGQRSLASAVGVQLGLKVADVKVGWEMYSIYVGVIVEKYGTFVPLF